MTVKDTEGHQRVQKSHDVINVYLVTPTQDSSDDSTYYKKHKCS